jgi:hypothetical protein
MKKLKDQSDSSLMVAPDYRRFIEDLKALSMIGLIEPPMIAVMEPLKSVPKATSDGSANYEFSPPFGVVFSAF